MYIIRKIDVKMGRVFPRHLKQVIYLMCEMEVMLSANYSPLGFFFFFFACLNDKVFDVK